jgi:hypothetical protein
MLKGILDCPALAMPEKSALLGHSLAFVDIAVVISLRRAWLYPVRGRAGHQCEAANQTQPGQSYDEEGPSS